MIEEGRSGRPRPHRQLPIPLSRVREAAGIAPAAPAVDRPAPEDEDVVSGVTLKAQEVVPGDVFAALPGSRVHGAVFAGRALERGAAAILTDPDGAVRVDDADVPVLVHERPRDVLGAVSSRIYGDPSRSLDLIGITGTAGKTTTSYLVESGLMAQGRHVGLIGTVETRIDGRRTPSALTTPEAPDLQALLALMVERGVDSVVMEVSSHALALGRVDGCRFAVAGFTNLSQDHLDFHGDMNDYFAAKARLFAAGSAVRAAAAVVCIDDRWGGHMSGVARGAPPLPTATVAIGPASGHADWTAGPATLSAAGTQRFSLRGPHGGDTVADLPLPGRFNVGNALLAAGLLDCAGISPATSVRGFAGVAVPGRLERIDRGQPFLAVVDFAHKPAAVEAVVGTLRAQTSGRLAVVVGAGGDRDAAKRPLMGEAAARGADFVVVTDDNPRTEDPAAIRADVLAGAHGVPAAERGRVVEAAGRAFAIETAVAWAAVGDTVLVAGKGHETGQEIDGVTHPFDDRDVLAAAMDAAMDATHAAGAVRGSGGRGAGSDGVQTTVQRAEDGDDE